MVVLNQYSSGRSDGSVVSCKWCGCSTTMIGTKECDFCYELRSRIDKRPDLARAMLDAGWEGVDRTKVNLDKYEPGQLITSMTRRAFLELWEEMLSGVAQERWLEGRVAETRKERTEDLRIRAIAMIFKDHRDVFNDLLITNWRRLEVYMGDADLLYFRVLKDQTAELENLKALRRRGRVR